MVAVWFATKGKTLLSGAEAWVLHRRWMAQLTLKEAFTWLCGKQYGVYMDLVAGLFELSPTSSLILRLLGPSVSIPSIVKAGNFGRARNGA